MSNNQWSVEVFKVLILHSAINLFIIPELKKAQIRQYSMVEFKDALIIQVEHKAFLINRIIPTLQLAVIHQSRHSYVLRFYQIIDFIGRS